MGQLTGDLEPDPFIGAGDQRDALIIRPGAFLEMSVFWKAGIRARVGTMLPPA
ncbi:hypothetical protein [Bosea sp. 685]|uniref:hypothetical protein n=1 Tax=Bosea sp. 685 TaxID=3080057 RepID=UPI0028931032|nr:hypothetical protein [Bosea sp. 685]WNJ92289.1 hypothetical protein RMR04_08320 [Bosea sp. 685]